MDLRSLINKLDTIEQKKLLLEAEQLMEKVRIRYSDVEAVAKQYPTDDDARGKAIAKLAADNGLQTLFDPISGELVKADGSYASIVGADEATVNRLKSWGLLPLNAKTSSWLGARGQDRKTAIGDNQSAQGRDQMVDRAEELMKKAVTAGTSAVAAKESIAESLLREFGYSTALLEYVTPEEHTELKGLVQKLTPFAKQDPDSADIVARFNAYNERRNDLIARIKEVIAAIKPAITPKDAKAVAPSGERSGSSATATKESLQESKQRMITEGRVIMLEDGSVIKDGQHYLYNESRDTYYYHDENGLLVEYSAGELWSDVKDTGRGVVSGATYGLQDPILAKAWSMVNGTNYHDELKKQIAQTDAARKRSPWLYSAGQVGGWFVNPISYTGVGGVAGAATSIGTEIWRDEMNAALLKASEPSTKERKGGGGHPKKKPEFDPKVKALQQQLMKWYGPDAVGPKKDDGLMGNDTMKAIKRAQKDGKLPSTEQVVSTPASSTAVASAEPSSVASAEPSSVAAADSLAPGEEIVAPSSSVASTPASAPASHGRENRSSLVTGTTASSTSDTSVASSAPAASSSVATQSASGNMTGGYGSGANNPELAQTTYTPDASITPELVKGALAKVGVTGNTISPEQILQVASALGIEGAVAESKELQDIRRLAGTEQLDELWELVPKVAGMAGRGIETGWNALKGLLGGTAAADTAAARTATTSATDAAAAARTATNAADTLPNVLRQGGKTYDKVGNTYKVRGGSEVVSVDDMAIRLGRADGRLSPGGTRVAAQDAASANAARRTGAATDAMARAGNAERAAGGTVAGAERAAGGTVAGAERAAGAVVGAERAAVALPGAATRIVNSVKALGGKFVNLLKNNRFLTLIAVLGAIGLVTSGGSSSTTTTTTDTNGPVSPHPAVDQKEEERKRQEEEERKRQLLDLEKLLARLYGGWPTDAETAETIKAAVAAGAKAPEGFKEGGVNAQPASSSSASSDRVFGGRGHAMSAQDLATASGK
jgi:hypothetical protein